MGPGAKAACEKSNCNVKSRTKQLRRVVWAVFRSVQRQVVGSNRPPSCVPSLARLKVLQRKNNWIGLMMSIMTAGYIAEEHVSVIS